MEIFGAEMAYGVGTPGLSESLRYFQAKYPDIKFPLVDIPPLTPDPEPLPNLKNLVSVTEVNRRIKAYAAELLKQGMTPLYVGGDHSAAIGTVAASTEFFPGQGLIWVDAHADIHLPETSWSGNIHGMPVAVALGRGAADLVGLFSGGFLKPEHIVMLGLRDIDFAEQKHLDNWGIRYYTYEAIEVRGLDTVITESLTYLEAKGVNGVHLSVDLDSMDPQLMPAVSVPVGGGFTPEALEYLISNIFEHVRVNAMDLVEYNHAFDRADVTAKWLAKMLKHLSREEI